MTSRTRLRVDALFAFFFAVKDEGGCPEGDGLAVVAGL